MTTSNAPAYSRRDVDTIIGENIHRLMWRAKEGQTDIAKKLGVTPSAVSNKLRGKRPWYAAEIDLMADHYRVTPGSLFRELPVIGELPHLDSNQEPTG